MKHVSTRNLQGPGKQVPPSLVAHEQSEAHPTTSQGKGQRRAGFRQPGGLSQPQALAPPHSALLVSQSSQTPEFSLEGLQETASEPPIWGDSWTPASSAICQPGSGVAAAWCPLSTFRGCLHFPSSCWSGTCSPWKGPPPQARTELGEGMVSAGKRDGQMGGRGEVCGRWARKQAAASCLALAL